MATSVIYFSLVEIRLSNPNLSGGRHRLAQAAWTALRRAVLETDAPILPRSRIYCVCARFLLPPGLVLRLPGDYLSTRVTPCIHPVAFTF